MIHLLLKKFVCALCLFLIRGNPSKSALTRIANEGAVKGLSTPDWVLDLATKKHPTNLLAANELKFSETVTRPPPIQDMNFRHPSPKENWTLKYYCGRVIVVEDHGNELYNTGCCYCNASSQTNLNSAEILVNKCVYGFGKIALKIISALLGHEDRNRSSKRYGGK
uniref:Uncharacterized protein n=1 Tax=Phakopsora pachyrhizi TaxID=170000 RepID=A0A0S1MIW9_PHAPC